MINTAGDARRAVEAAKYPPVGSRSWGPTRAAFDVDDYTPEAGNRRTVLAAMIETPDGVRSMDAFLSTPGIDAAYIGPSDLVLGHGMEPTLAVRGTEHEQLARSILDSCERNGVVTGIHCDSVQTVQRWQDLGFGMTTLASDAVLLRGAASAGRRQLTGQAEEAGGANNYA